MIFGYVLWHLSAAGNRDWAQAATVSLLSCSRKLLDPLSNKVMIRNFDWIRYLRRISKLGYINEHVFTRVLEFRCLYPLQGPKLACHS